MRDKFNEQLEQLNEELTKMGELVEKAIGNAVLALTKEDAEFAKAAIAFDSEVDRKEKDIEAICLRLLLHQQPVASDLRTVSSALKMITDMERIGDMAADISEIASMQTIEPKAREMVHIPKMAEATIKMVNDSISAFVKKDVALASRVIAEDDVVDDLFSDIKTALAELIYRDKAMSTSALDLLMVAKYFERIGDHATNIAEWVVFSITGEHE